LQTSLLYTYLYMHIHTYIYICIMLHTDIEMLSLYGFIICL
jgi:hypothetical protein